MRRRILACVCFVAASGACAATVPRASPPPGEVPSPSPSLVVSAEPSRAERCAGGDLVVCGDIAWTRARTIHPEDQEGGKRDLRSLCDRGLADACSRWADLTWATDPTASRAAYERGCSLGSSLSCGSLGVVLDNESSGSTRGHELLQKACDAGSAEGCAWLADTMHPKEWKEPEIGAYWALMTRACAGKVPRACRVVGEREKNGNGVPRDAVSAAGHFQIACDGRDGEGCTHYGLALESGTGIVQDEKGAARAFGIACDEADAEGCYHLARAYITASGVAADEPHATELLHRACRAGHHPACGRLARDAKLQPDRARRLATLTQLCGEKAMVACQSLGETLRWMDAAERAPALARLEEACASGITDACLSGYRAATMTNRTKKVRGQVREALGFLERACNAKEGGFGCFVLAEQLLGGEFVKKDPKRGAEVAIERCLAEGGAVCRLAGNVLEGGTGTPRDLPGAVRAYTKACDDNDAAACRALSKMKRSGRGTEKDAAAADELARKAEELDED
jgi:uncharacterized protein